MGESSYALRMGEDLHMSPGNSTLFRIRSPCTAWYLYACRRSRSGWVPLTYTADKARRGMSVGTDVGK